jgi:hypothetical protein
MYWESRDSGESYTIHMGFMMTFSKEKFFLVTGKTVSSLNPFTASCENAMTLSVPGVPASCEKFPHFRQLNF